MPQRIKMTDSDVLTALERLEAAAELADDSETERARSLGIYRGENLRPAPDGRSQVVDRTAWSVVEGAKPQLLKLFLSGEEVCRFDPVGPEDIKGSEQESKAVNHIITQKNPAFNIFSGWLHDGMVQRVGYVKAYVETADEVERERYESLTQDELAFLLQDKDIDIIEQEPGMNMLGEPVYTVVVERKAETQHFRVVNLPPESVLVDADHSEVSLSKCRFVQTRVRKTISELREMGFDVADDINDSGNERDDYLDQYRRNATQIDVGGREGEEADPSMRLVLVRESWVRIDKDGDGIASLYHTIVVGKELLECEDADHIPVIAWCPIPQPHMHRGYSLVDETKEIGEIKTWLTRAILDGTALATSPRFALDPARVSLDDFLISRPGGVVRVDGNPAEAMMPLTQPFNPGPAMQALEYMDVQRELVTGIPRIQQGQLDPLSQNKTATGISQVFAAGQQRIELIARYFGEAVRELCLVVHQLLSKHSKKPLVMMLDNEFIATDPRAWAKRTDMSISVGLGSGNRFEQTQFLQQILTVMFGPALPMGLTSPDKIYNALAKLTTAVGYKNPEEFWNNTQGQPPPPPPPDPNMVKVQQDGEIKKAELQMDAQASQQEMGLEQQKLQQEAMFRERELQLKIEEMKLSAQVELEKARMKEEYGLRAARIQAVQARNQAKTQALSKVKSNG